MWCKMMKPEIKEFHLRSLDAFIQKRLVVCYQRKPDGSGCFFMKDEEDEKETTGSDAYCEASGVNSISVYKNQRWYWSRFVGFRKEYPFASVNFPNGKIKERAFKQAHSDPKSKLWLRRGDYA